jgi:hypothetical protein
MNAEDLLILGAIGVGVYYFMHQSTAAAAASPAGPIPLAPTPAAPSINVQPSTIPLSNPIASLAPAPSPMPALAPSPGPAPAPPIPVMAVLPPPSGGVTYTIPAPPPPSSGPFLMVNSDPLPTPENATTSASASGPTPPIPTVQPGVIMTASAPVASIQVAPSPTPGPVAFTPPPVVYNPQMTWALSRGGSTLYPGDTWSINIWGAKPGSPVSMTLTQQGGSSATNNIGTVNSSGNFWYTGTVGTGQDGQWSQVWYVGGQQVESFSFAVFDPVVNAVVPTTTYNSNIPNSPIGTATAPRTGNLIVGGVVYGGAPLNI